MIAVRRLVPPPLPVTLAATAVCYAVSYRFMAIEITALIGIVALVAATGRLLVTLQVTNAWRWAALAAVLPGTMLNTVLLGRYDALYAAPCIMALEAAMGRRHGHMLAWYGGALALTFQMAVLAPFVVALLIRRRVRLQDWCIPLAVFAVLPVAMWAFGRPAGALSAISYGLSGHPPLAFGAPGIWSVAQAFLPQQAALLVGLALAAAVGATGAYIAHFSVRMPDGMRALPVAVLAVLVTAGLLPHMPPHAFLVADIAAFAWAAAGVERRAWGIALLIQAGSTLAAMASVLDAPGLVVLGCACMGAATYRIAAPLLRPAANDNPIMARAV